MAEQQWNRLYYDEWVAREGLELIRGHRVADVYTVPLRPWARAGGSAVCILLDGTGEMVDAQVVEIPPGKHLAPQKHLYEELVYVLSGRGSTSVWYPDRPRQTFEWQKGSLFALPLNACYQHFNGSGAEPARYIAVTTAPIMMNLIRNDDFMFDNAAVFPERYNSEADFFSGDMHMEDYNLWDFPSEIAFSNFFADIHAVPMHPMNRAPDSQASSFEVGNGVLGAHMAEFPGGSFTNLHRHGPGAHVLWLSGEGYSLIFPDGGEKVKADWGPGSILVPPSWWWHQHCVVSHEPAQYLALKLSSKRFKVNSLSRGTMLSTRKGGNMLHLEDFPPGLLAELRQLFEAECARRGTTPRLEGIAEGG
jgi:uncharacterized RmlC-like cupin family protein